MRLALAACCALVACVDEPEPRTAPRLDAHVAVDAATHAPHATVDAHLTDAAVDRPADVPPLGSMTFAPHAVVRVDEVAIPPRYWLTRRLPLRASTDGVDGFIELWNHPKYQPLRWSPATSSWIFVGSLVGNEDDPVPALVRVVTRDGRTLGQIAFVDGVADLRRQPVPSAKYPSFVLAQDTIIGFGPWNGLRYFVLAVDHRGLGVAVAHDAAGRPHDITLLDSAICAWSEAPVAGSDARELHTTCYPMHVSARGSQHDRRYVHEQRFWHDGVRWRFAERRSALTVHEQW